MLNLTPLDKCASFVTEPKILCEVGTEAKEDQEGGGQDCDRLTFFPVLNETPAPADGSSSPCTPEPCSSMQDCPDIRLILQELHPREKVLLCSTGGCVGMPRLKTTRLNTSATPPHSVNIHNHNYLM